MDQSEVETTDETGFSESVRRLARLRARGTCECTQSSCPHYNGCRTRASEYHHKKALVDGGDNQLANCQFLCHACHDRIHRPREGLGRV